MKELEYSQLSAYLRELEQNEKSKATREQYERYIRHFLNYRKAQCQILQMVQQESTNMQEESVEQEILKESVLQYKEFLQTSYKPATVNVILTALNGFFAYIGKPHLQVRQLKIQRSPYCQEGKELTKNEYLRLVRTAKKEENERLELLLQTICGTGIRVSELCYITVEAVRSGQASVQLKGKNRVIMLSSKLRKRLKTYIKRQKLASGPIFITRNGKPMDRSNIWKMLKALSKAAHVEAQKVFPHNLRHLFARSFYKIEKDIAKLADLLGHSSINTTRIYIISTGEEHRRQMDAMELVI